MEDILETMADHTGTGRLLPRRITTITGQVTGKCLTDMELRHINLEEVSEEERQHLH